MLNYQSVTGKSFFKTGGFPASHEPSILGNPVKLVRGTQMHPDSWTLAPVAIALWHLRCVFPEQFLVYCVQKHIHITCRWRVRSSSSSFTQENTGWTWMELSPHSFRVTLSPSLKALHTYGSTLTQKTFWWCQRRSTTQQCQFPHWPWMKNHHFDLPKTTRPRMPKVVVSQFWDVGGFLKWRFPNMVNDKSYE